jgi:hypothetical protein
MSFRLEKLVTVLLQSKEYEVVDKILDNLDVESSGNVFTDLVDLVQICNKEYQNLQSLGWFKKRLVNKIYEQRGDEGNNLISKVMQ